MTMEIEDGNRTITISGEIERAYKALAAFELENNRPDPNRSPQQRRIDAMERALAAASHADATPVASGPLTYDWNGHTDIPVGRPDLSDFEVAVKVRMLMRDQLDHEAICELARDRIMGLSKRVAALSAPATPPPAGSVTDEMVERALDAYFNDPDWRKGPHAEFINDGARAGMRAALAAAPVPPVVGEDAVETLRFYANPHNWTSGRWVRGSEEDDDADEPVAHLICIDRQIEEGGFAVPFADCGDRARKALAALASSVPVGAALSQSVQVKVKALEWDRIDYGSGPCWRGIGLGTTYFVHDDGRWSSAIDPDWRNAGTPDAAKAAAQADYERRVLSSVEAAPGWREPDFIGNQPVLCVHGWTDPNNLCPECESAPLPTSLAGGKDNG